MIELIIAFILGALAAWLWISWRKRRQNFIKPAEKECLDRIGELYNITREPKECDAAYRKRMMDTITSTGNMRNR